MSEARILVVDDSLTIRRALEFILKPHGYALEFAADGREALDRATAFNPDLVLLDYVLPDMRGPDVCAALSAVPETASTPVILVSAKGASIRQAYQDAQNVVSYITKPFKPEVVIAVVANALSRGRAGHAIAPPAPASAPARLAAPPTFGPAPRARELGPAEARTPTPVTVEQTFSAFLRQLEDALAGDGIASRSPGRGHQGFPRALTDLLRPGLEQLATHVREVTDHLVDGGIAPYRLRRDGSFANLAQSLLDAHRLLCAAAISLAAAGTPGPRLPGPPRLLAALPAEHPLAGDVRSAIEVAPEIAGIAIEGEFEQLPHLVKLLAPEVVLAPDGADPALDEALRRARETAPAGTRFAALGPSPEGALDEGRERVADAAGVAALVEALAHEAAATEPEPAMIDLAMEVVAV